MRDEDLKQARCCDAPSAEDVKFEKAFFSGTGAPRIEMQR